MYDVRSRAGVVALTTSAAVFLSLPVVAAGQVPGVDQVVGGVQETAESLVPAPAAPVVPDLPAVSAPAPAPAAPAPAPAAPAPAAPAPSAPASAPAPDSGRTSVASTGDTASTGSSKRSSVTAAASSTKKQERGEARDAGVVAGASQDAADKAPSDTAAASQVADAPEDANPSTLPFTGFQLLLMAMLGTLALVGGLTLRRAGR